MARPHAVHLNTRRIGSADLVVEMLVWSALRQRRKPISNARSKSAARRRAWTRSIWKKAKALLEELA
jgi:hypothetical protein